VLRRIVEAGGRLLVDCHKNLSTVTPGLVPGIRALLGQKGKAVDGRDKPGHDEL
jgi:hypothetical protein